RPRKLVPRYRQVWLQDGSPLLVWSQAQAQGVQKALLARGIHAHVDLGMRYGNPPISSAMQSLRAKGCDKILTVPMYPQYAASTTATAVDCVAAYAAKLRDQPELRFIKRYHDDPAYIGALALQVQRYWQLHGKPQRLLLSFHGLPRRVIEQGDPYHRDCVETTLRLKELLGDDADLVYMSFQSRFGAERWLEPYTEPTLKAWAAQGVRRVDVMCPGFLADCLETLEEIQVECHDAFKAAGGEQFRYISCLNDDSVWAEGFATIIERHLVGWHY
ncbi:MAG TPA: ferrochelatase, partial [Eoetvoesiella sp.]